MAGDAILDFEQAHAGSEVPTEGVRGREADDASPDGCRATRTGRAGSQVDRRPAIDDRGAGEGAHANPSCLRWDVRDNTHRQT